ncbi:unnamed protein product [Phaeothamnion confervicola]
MEPENAAAVPRAAQLLVEMLSSYPDLPPELTNLLEALGRLSNSYLDFTQRINDASSLTLSLLPLADDGEAVQLGGVSDETLRNQLAGFLSASAVAGGPVKSDDAALSAGEFMEGAVLGTILQLLDVHILRESSEPSNGAASMAAAGTTVAAAMAASARAIVAEESAASESCAAVVAELPPLLKQVASRELVVIDGVRDIAVRRLLTRLFVALGLERRSGSGDDENGGGGNSNNSAADSAIDMGYGLPEDPCEELAMQAVRCMIASCNSDARVSGKSGGCGSNGKPAATPTKRAAVGPAMPTAAQLAQAQQVAALRSARGEDAAVDSSPSDDDEAMGPAPEATAKRRAAPDAGLRHAKRVAGGSGKAAAAGAAMVGAAEGAGAGAATRPREEWMMTPPAFLGTLSGVKTLDPNTKNYSTRSRRAMAVAAKGAAAVAGVGGGKSKEELASEAEALRALEAHRKARGPSLATLHAQESGTAAARAKSARRKLPGGDLSGSIGASCDEWGDGRKGGGGGGGSRGGRGGGRGGDRDGDSDDGEVGYHDGAGGDGSGGRGGGGGGGGDGFSWSRDDMEQRKRMTPQQYAELVQKSKELDSRFSRQITRNFL